MTSAPPVTPMTAEQFFDMETPSDETRYELVRGKLVCMSPSSQRSNKVGITLLMKMGPFIDQHRLGEYGGFEAGFRLASNPDTVRAPDVWFIRADRIPPEGLPDAYWQGPPDLAVEVLSPSDRSRTILDKLRDYLELGVRLVWIIDPESRWAVVFRPGQVPVFIDEDGFLDGGDVVPGFRVTLREILPS